MMRPPPISTLFPYTTLFRSAVVVRKQDIARQVGGELFQVQEFGKAKGEFFVGGDRKSTRLNSSHLVISYAVFCLKKKKIVRMTWISLISPLLYLSVRRAPLS